MRSSLRISRSAVWLAVLAILAACLLPAFGQMAASASGDQGWLEVCTAYGIERIALSDLPDTGDSDTPMASQGCVWCHLHAHGAPPPGGMTGLLLIVADSGRSPVGAPCDSPSPQFFTTASRPRAPPARL
nr:DUF2946 domain-containing protein [Thauera sedimentorum]